MTFYSLSMNRSSLDGVYTSLYFPLTPPAPIEPTVSVNSNLGSFVFHTFSTFSYASPVSNHAQMADVTSFSILSHPSISCEEELMIEKEKEAHAIQTLAEFYLQSKKQERSIQHKSSIHKKIGKRKRKNKLTKKVEDFYCSHCEVTTTPEVRRGPLGDGSLCNACGLQYAKKIKLCSDSTSIAEVNKFFSKKNEF